MSKFRIFKILACSIAILSLTFTGQLRSESTSSGQNISEPVGKQDPFETVQPIADVRKNVSQRIAALKDTVEEMPDLYVETMMLKFLKASNVERVVSKLLSSQGVVTTDQETNSLVICDTREQLDRIVEEVRKADLTPKQIMIEVVIVDVQLNDETEIGVNWQILSDKVHTLGFEQIFAMTSEGGFLGLTQNNIRVVINALQQVRNVEILASPRVLVLSGQEAEIRTVEELPYEELTQTSEGGAMTAIKFKEAGIKLSVKATITDDHKILMAIEPEQSVEIGTGTVSGSDVPIVDLRAAKTTLLMNDGQVLVMGGLRKRETRVTDDKVPVLGDLPILGPLFSNDKTEVKNTELLVMISPHIMDDDEAPTAEQIEQYKRITEGPGLKFEKRTRPEWEAISEALDFSEDK